MQDKTSLRKPGKTPTEFEVRRCFLYVAHQTSFVIGGDIIATPNKNVLQKAEEIKTYVQSPENCALLMTNEQSRNLDASHAVQQHQHKSFQFMIDRLANESAREYVSSTYGNIGDLTQRGLKALSLKIANWLLQEDRKAPDYRSKELYVKFSNPIGNGLSKDGKEYESRMMKIILGRNRDSDIGFVVKSVFPDAERAIELEKKRDPSKEPVPFFRGTGFQIVPESELLSEAATTSKPLRIYRKLRMLQDDLSQTKIKNASQVKIKYTDLEYGKGKLVIKAMTSKLAGYIEIDNEARVKTYTKDPNQFEDKAKEQPIKLQTLAAKIPELRPYVQEISKYASIIRASSKSYDSVEVMSTEEAEGKIRYTDASKRAQSLDDVEDRSKARLYFPDKTIFSDGYIVRDSKTNKTVFLEAATGYRTTLDPDKLTTDLSKAEGEEVTGNYTLDVYEKEILVPEQSGPGTNSAGGNVVIEKETTQDKNKIQKNHSLKEQDVR